MIDELKAMAIFVETIKQGSFRGASAKLGLSPSVVSYHVNQLEERVGNALIYRSTRKLSLTSEGQLLFEHAEKMLVAAEEGLGLVSATRTTPKGALTVTAPTSLTRGPLAEKVAAFKSACPEIELTIIYTDKRQDLIADGIDLAIRVGEMADSSLMARQIGEFERPLVCSPSYFANQPEPGHPIELSHWQWIKHSMVPSYRTFMKGTESVDVPYVSSLAVNSVDALAQLSILGLGLSTPPALFVQDAITAGTLIEVLPEWRVKPIPIYAVWPNNVSTASNTRLLLNHLCRD